jgi:transcriptional regulator with XRE-family HTH domain
VAQKRSPHQVLVEQVKTLRRGRGWSGQRLAEEMTARGIPWDRSIVANLENGRRSVVSVDEMLALAYIFDIAPVHLLVPIDASDNLEPVPGVTASPDAVRAWIRAKDTIGSVDVRRFASQVPAHEFGPDRHDLVSAAYMKADLARIQELGETIEDPRKLGEGGLLKRLDEMRAADREPPQEGKGRRGER